MVRTDNWEMEVTPDRGSVDLDIAYTDDEGVLGEQSVGARVSVKTARALAEALRAAAGYAEALADDDG